MPHSRDDPVDPDRAGPVPAEQLVRRVEDPLARGRPTADGRFRCHSIAGEWYRAGPTGAFSVRRRTSNVALACRHDGPRLTIGVLHPGEMGAALGARLRERRPRRGAGRARGAARRPRTRAARRACATPARPRRSRGGRPTSSSRSARRTPPSTSPAPWPAAAGSSSTPTRSRPRRSRGIRAVVEGAGGRFVDGGIVGPPPERAGHDAAVPVRARGATRSRPRSTAPWSRRRSSAADPGAPRR